MSGRTASAALAVVSVLVLATATGAQVVMSGTVRDDSTSRPLRGAEIRLEGNGATAHTDSLGGYTLQIPAGRQIVVFRSPGYQLFRTMVIARKDTVHADASLLHAGATPLDTVKVNAQARARTLGRDGLIERKRLGFGVFVDSTQLRKKDATRLSDALRTWTSIRFVDAWEGSVVETRAVSPLTDAAQPYQISGARAGTSYPVKLCYVSVFVDGSPVYRSDIDQSDMGRPPDLSREFPVSSLEAIEYYKSASEVPQQFGGPNANCGALVLWTRR